MAKQQDTAAVARVMALRMGRTPAAVVPHTNLPGAHVWASSGLNGFAGGSPVNTWALSGLEDPWAYLRAKQHDPNDWVTTIVKAYDEKKKEAQRG